MITTSHVARRWFLSGAAAFVAITRSTPLGSGCAQMFRRHPDFLGEQLCDRCDCGGGAATGRVQTGRGDGAARHTGRVAVPGQPNFAGSAPSVDRAVLRGAAV